MLNKNSKHSRHNHRRRNGSASTRVRAPGQELGHDAAAWRAVKTAAGAAGAALACAFIARKEWLPPKLITGVVSVVGAVFAVGGRSETLRAVGAGAMSAAGTQLGLMLLDERSRAAQLRAAVATKPSNADRIPPDALEPAFARARARLRWAPLGAAPLGDRRNAAESPPGATGETMQIPRIAETDVIPFVTTAADSATVDIRDTWGTQSTQDSHGAQPSHMVEVSRAAEAAHEIQSTHQAEVTHDAQAPYDAQAPQSSPSGLRSPSPLTDKPNSLDNLIGSIRTATVPGASAEVRGIGATACRAILTALETQVGQPLTAAPARATSPTVSLSGMLSHLASMPREQLIELLTNRLRGALPLGAPTRLVAGPRYHTIPIPQVHAQVSG